MHDAMDQTSLLPQCNGDMHQSDLQPEFYSQRRATMAASEGPASFRSEQKVCCLNPQEPSSNKGISFTPSSDHSLTTILRHEDTGEKHSVPSYVDDRRYGQRLERDSKTTPRYGSTVTNIGVEYMKATGTMGVRFKQLQKPSLSKSHDSIACEGHRQRSNSAGVGNLCSELPLIIPMTPRSVNTENCNSSFAHRRHSQKNGDPQQHYAGYRLGQRKTLAERRRKVADYSCVFALLGLGFMIIEMECTISGLYSKEDIPSYVIKAIITLTSLALLALIGVYHGIEVRLFVVDNCIEDWRITMSWGRLSQIMLELVICAIHPVPGSHYFKWSVLDIKTLIWKQTRVPVDVIFSLPMFIRLYLIVRVMMLHSKLFTDASSRSIGALNKITFNTRFVLKTLMNIFPGTVLVVFMLSLWIICAWILRACECWHDPLLMNLLNSLYLIAITFLSVGYGDFVPHTYCGRGVSVLSGLMGAGCTALVVAVIAKKLELTRAEKHVHNFMIENQLSKKLKDAAANVLRETWLIYKYTKLVKRVSSTRVRTHQRKFLQAIQDLRRVKLKQRKLADQANSLTDFAKTTSMIFEMVSDIKLSQNSYDARVESLEHALALIMTQMEALPEEVAKMVMNRDVTRSSLLRDKPNLQQTPLHIRPRGLRHYDMNQNSFDSGP